METMIELPHATDLRYSYVRGIAKFPGLWNVIGGYVCFKGVPVFSATFDQREIYSLVGQAEFLHEQILKAGR